MRMIFPFEEDCLTEEMHRLCSIFTPEWDVSHIRVQPGRHKYSVAAHAFTNENRIVMYDPYHHRYPEDYKSTILHEVGHIILGPTHGKIFYDYYLLLRKRQKDILEKAVPNTFDEFLYSKEVREYKYKYICSSCRSYFMRKNNMQNHHPVCEPCSQTMLLVSL